MMILHGDHGRDSSFSLALPADTLHLVQGPAEEVDTLYFEDVVPFGGASAEMNNSRCIEDPGLHRGSQLPHWHRRKYVVAGPAVDAQADLEDIGARCIAPVVRMTYYSSRE